MRLVIDNVRKSFGTQVVLDRFSLTASAGEFVSIEGPSGSGKSTLLSLIAGWERPNQGTIVFQDIQKGDGVDLLPQSTPLFLRRSAIDNVVLGALALGFEPNRARRGAERALEEVGLGHVRDRRARLLSGGERQRVAVARSLVRKPAVLLADEVTASLDAPSVRAIAAALRALADAGTLVVAVTHDERVAERAHRRIALLDDSRNEPVT